MLLCFILLAWTEILYNIILLLTSQLEADQPQECPKESVMVEPGTNFQNQVYQGSHLARTVQIPTGVASRLKNSRQTAWFCSVLFTTPDKTFINVRNIYMCHNLSLLLKTWSDLHHCNQFLPSSFLLQLISLPFKCFKLTYAILFTLNNAAFVLNWVLLKEPSQTILTRTRYF